jgi:hypothetical protein
MATQARHTQRELADRLFPVRIQDESEEYLNIPPEQRRLQTETYDFTISTIVELLRAEKIVIPEFQRKYVWNRAQASRLIESLIIQCPIPVIYLDQEPDETLKVIDGNQRIWSIRLYLKNKFRLRGLKAYPDLNGLLFRELDPRFQRHIENRTLRCITILKETHAQIKFDVFERLNTGAVQLNPQELRHGLYHGPLMDRLDELGEYEAWQELSGIRDDKRMRGAELILRFFALTEALDRYQKPLASFLTQFAADHRRGDRMEEWSTNFRVTVEVIRRLFGDKAFRLLDGQLAAEGNFNAAVFDAQMVGTMLSNASVPQITDRRRRAFLTRYRELQESDGFKRAITASTSDEALVRFRINHFRQFIEREFPA